MLTRTPLATAALAGIVRRTPDTYTLRLDTDVPFHPGQAVQLTFPGDPKLRYYSISSSPTEGRFVEVTVKADPDHPLGWIIPRLKAGDRLGFAGPFGSFRLSDPPAVPACFIAAGTGVAPFRSMIRFLLDRDLPVDAWLLHSVASKQGLLFFEEFTAWSAASSRFRYVPTITQKIDNDWKRETGRISDELVRRHIPHRQVDFFLCGAPGFVNDLEHLLRTHLEVPPGRIHREQW